jgi:hypothetical protein
MKHVQGQASLQSVQDSIQFTAKFQFHYYLGNKSAEKLKYEPVSIIVLLLQ